MENSIFSSVTDGSFCFHNQDKVPLGFSNAPQSPTWIWVSLIPRGTWLNSSFIPPPLLVSLWLNLFYLCVREVKGAEEEEERRGRRRRREGSAAQVVVMKGVFHSLHSSSSSFQTVETSQRMALNGRRDTICLLLRRHLLPHSWCLTHMFPPPSSLPIYLDFHSGSTLAADTLTPLHFLTKLWLLPGGRMQENRAGPEHSTSVYIRCPTHPVYTQVMEQGALWHIY